MTGKEREDFQVRVSREETCPISPNTSASCLLLQDPKGGYYCDFYDNQEFLDNHVDTLGKILLKGHYFDSECKKFSLKMVHAPHFLADTIEFTQQTCDQDSLSTAQSHMDEDLATQGVHSQDHSISSVSDENFKKLEEAQPKPILFMGNSSFGMNDLQLEKNAPMVQHAYVDHCFNGLYAAYGPQPMIQPHMVQIAPARVPLPLDLSEDGPVYVNAKQYHGILRRRQIRAKLEAQNKLVRNRRPYLHESRHKHAVNRVRGSGGRFLPSKTAEQSRASHSDCHIASREMILDHGFLWELRGNEGNHLGR